MTIPRIFISYSHDDEKWKDLLVKQLGVLEAEDQLEVWDDRRIETGADWLPEIERAGWNVRIVAAISPQLFRRQDRAYRERICSAADRLSGMAITNRARRLMSDWVIGPVAEEYSLGSDADDRWRTGGSVDEVMEEAHLDPGHILEAIERFARERPERLRRLHDRLEAAEGR